MLYCLYVSFSFQRQAEEYSSFFYGPFGTFGCVFIFVWIWGRDSETGCVCVCVWERERERERNLKSLYKLLYRFLCIYLQMHVLSWCMCIPALIQHFFSCMCYASLDICMFLCVSVHAFTHTSHCHTNRLFPLPCCRSVWAAGSSAVAAAAPCQLPRGQHFPPGHVWREKPPLADQGKYKKTLNLFLTIFFGVVC